MGEIEKVQKKKLKQVLKFIERKGTTSHSVKESVE